METNETRKGKYSKIILKEKKNSKNETLLEKEWGVSSFSKLQTCIQIKIYIKMKKKHFIFIIQNNNNNNNNKHIKIKNVKC